MNLDAIFRVLFVIYCAEAGLLLVVAPWSAVLWDRNMVQLAWPLLREMALHPLFRGAVTGFGVVHLCWGTHDLQAWLARRPTES